MEPDIKIFVSHRIDIESELVDNPLYVPVRCGAVFDDRNPMGIAGDDTGDNISEKRLSFCEFTVQYWAWKNVQADYYGLCHYRRFLSFADKRFKTDEFNMVHAAELTPMAKRRYGLLNKRAIQSLIAECDAVTSEYAPVERIPLSKGKAATVRELWDAHDGLFFEKKVIPRMFELIDRMAPEYSESAREYFAGNLHRGFNCFVLRRELFDRMCRFQFPIMNAIAASLDTSGYTQTMLRTPAFVGEMLYGIFFYHITTRENWRVQERQLVFFANTSKIKSRWDLCKRYLWFYMDRALRFLADPILPKGTRRREIVKKILFAITPLEPRGVADYKGWEYKE